ncbi:putative Transcriptional regulator, ArsR family [Magnetospira sp. QH-2]|nr:putative Transcriptional regulator, ArsR family [Magnetospira sp. QH-2]
MEQARARLIPGGLVRVPYDCKACNDASPIVLASDEICADIQQAEPQVESAMAARLLIALVDQELCECDLATLIGGAESTVLRQLERLHADGLVSRRPVVSMVYYKLADADLQDRLRRRLGLVAEGA